MTAWQESCTIVGMLAPLLLTALTTVQAALSTPVAPPSDVASTEALPSGVRERAARALTEREARALGVGGYVHDAPGRDLDGRAHNWRDGAGERGTVLVMGSLTCPLCQKLAPEIARVEARARGVGFGFVHVALGELDGVE